jgi:pimeloyl-ACP methyl ester carboxylesterase
LHGFSDSVESWYEYGYVSSLAGDYRLIMVDALGHGASDKPHDPNAYNSTSMGVDLVGVLDACEVEQTHIFGYSMGGGMALVMAKLHPERLRSLIVGGASPVEIAESTELLDQLSALASQGAEALVEVWESQGSISPELRSRILANDMTALNAHWQSEDWVAVDDMLPSLGRPFLLIMGEKDEVYPAVKEYSGRVGEGSLVSLPGLNHLEVFQRSDLVIPIIAEFLNNI